MQIGERPVSPVEPILQRTNVHLLTSQRGRLEVAVWQYSICSPFWRIYVNNRKGGYLTFAGRRLDLLPGRCYMVPAWVQFETGLRRPLDQDYIHFTWMGLSSAMLRTVFPEPILLGRDECVEPLILRWRRRFDEQRPFDLADIAATYALVHAAIARLLSQLSREKREACFGWLSRSAELQAALDCIEQRLADPPTVAELAAAFHCSPSHFIRIFHKTVGLTPSQYGLERRIAMAAEWLAESSRTVDQIAESAGFTDRFHFSKAFKARLGIPPVAYRKLHASGEIA